MSARRADPGLKEKLLRYRRHLGLACFCLGLLLATATSSRAAVLLCSGLVTVAASAALRRVGLGALLGLILIAGVVVGDARVRAMGDSDLAGLAGDEVQVRGRLADRPRSGELTRSARVDARGVRTGGAAWANVSEPVYLRTYKSVAWPKLNVGDEVFIVGRVRKPGPLNGGEDGFDWGSHLKRNGISVELLGESIRRGSKRRGGFQGVVDNLRTQSEEALSVGLDSKSTALLKGMVLGSDEIIDVEEMDQFRRSGLAHLVAVSGQNVMLLVLLAMPILSWLGLGYRARMVGLIALIAVYVPLTGAEPPIQRAGIMAAAGIVAALAGRRSDRWYALLLAAGVTLAINPFSSADAGWQLSFAAVISIFWLAPKVERALRRLPVVVARSAAITISATVFTAPLLAHHFGYVSLVSLGANLLALPSVAPIMWLGMLSSAIGQLWLLPAEAINGLNLFFLGYLGAIAEWSSDRPYAVASISLPGWWQVALAFLSIVTAIHLMSRAARWAILRNRGVRVAVAAVCLLVGLVAVSSGRLSQSRPDRFTASFLDVGQGDATLLQTPDGNAALIDAGPPGAGIVGKLKSAGVERLDMVVLTHAQLDHYGGIDELLGRIKVGMLLDGGGASGSRSYRVLVARAERQGAKLVSAEAGQLFGLGRLRLRVLKPEEPEAGSGDADDPNSNAVVIHASYGRLDIFLPADAESEDWEGIGLPDVEVLKVAHHGSGDEGLETALDRLSPELAVVSVGRDNRYGHPHLETLDALRRFGAAVDRTDNDGTVKVSYAGGSLQIKRQAGHSDTLKRIP